MKTYTRRQFIDHSAKVTAGVLGYSQIHSSITKASQTQSNRSTVIVVKHDQASEIKYIGTRRINSVNQEAAQVMIDTGIRRLTGIDDLGEAWKSVFPGITQDKVIGIKLNCIARQDHYNGLASHPEVAYSIVNGLTSMQVDGRSFPEENIIIWDRSEFEMERSDFAINKSDTGVKCYGTRYEIMRDGHVSGGYSTDVLYDVAGIGQYISEILVDHCDYLINTCLFKDHVYSGVTLSLKNHYGSCWAPLRMHTRDCNPFIPALNALAPIRDKQMLVICDAIFGIVSGGPMGPPQNRPHTIMFSKDPVALDTIGTQMLQDYGTSSYTIRKAKHIETAAQDPYNLGTNDPDQIDVTTIENPETRIDTPENDLFYPRNFQIFQNYPNPFNTQTTITYQLYKPSIVRLEIYNIQGVLVRRLVNERKNSGYYRVSWDGRTFDNTVVLSGTYLAQFQCDDVRHSIRMQLIK